ncbi:MAG: L-2-amino-thiazoline-4-carboxylic acid hydrolase [Rhodospirillaceae bacterium]|nr:L-2-amino-thiazoline-4-carboxylic acid hydrolase [Rhodospirillaceae bacterium]MDD9913749.1 L-2-amino-thiazoline-4-carboxylic acid hydrolase [Rhodospirillaceae bacterium]MDD9929889.1 L-2-amino-thiazoline-4-carboxylic acid hydrolase [Rhodospirillaceae bacterium]
MAQPVHPYYEAHREAMVAEMRQRLDLAAPMIRARTALSDLDGIGREAMDAFETVMSQLPDVGGAANRMSDFFMRYLGFMAIGRVLRRRGVPVPVISDIVREVCTAQLRAEPEADRLAAGQQYLSPENQAVLREQAEGSMTEAHRTAYPDDFAYAFVEPGPDDSFEFGIDYKSCGFCKFAARHSDEEILPALCGLDFDAYAARGIKLERTQTLAGGASHCNFRFSRLPSE